MNKPAEYRQGESLFLIRPFEPFEALHVLGELQKVVGPVIGGATKSLKDYDMDEEINLILLARVVGNVFESLPSRINGKQLEEVARLLLRTDYISFSHDGTEKNLVKFTETVIDEYFTGRPFDLIALMIQVAKVNYLDFSKLLSIPTGWREVLTELKESFQGMFQTDSNP